MTRLRNIVRKMRVNRPCIRIHRIVFSLGRSFHFVAVIVAIFWTELDGKSFSVLLEHPLTSSMEPGNNFF